MGLISTRTHAINDYIFGILLIAVPLMVSREQDASVWVPVGVGALLLVQSLFTRYELSLAKVIPLSVHLSMDAMAGILLAASPWLFGFADKVWEPHFIVGIAEIALAAMTHVGATERAVEGSHVTRHSPTV